MQELLCYVMYKGGNESRVSFDVKPFLRVGFVHQALNYRDSNLTGALQTSFPAVTDHILFEEMAIRPI